MAVANKIRKVNSTGSEARAYGGPQVAGIEFDTATEQIVVAPESPPNSNRRAVPTVPLDAAGTPVGLVKISATVNPASVGANTTAAEAFTVAGVLSTDVLVGVQKPTHTSGLGIVGGFVSDDDEVTLVFQNTTGSNVDAASETYVFVLARE